MNFFRRIFIAVPYVWLLTFFAIPLFFIIRISLSDYEISIPPYRPQFNFADGWAGFTVYISQLDLETYKFIFSDNRYITALFQSISIATISTSLTLLIGYPIAYGISKTPSRLQAFLIILIIIPFTTSQLLRVYSMMGILSNEGFLNHFLMWLRFINEPLRILNTQVSVYIGIVYSYLPFMVLPIYASLENLDKAYGESAQDLGCSRLSAFWLVTLPISKPGVFAGCFIVFIPALGEFLIPNLLGGSSVSMLSAVLWDEFFLNRDWPVAAALAVLLLTLSLSAIAFFIHNQKKNASR